MRASSLAPANLKEIPLLNSACPIFPSQNFTATTEFYQQLGFVIGAQYEAEGYLILQRDDVELHFFRADSVDPYTSDHGAYLRVSDANDLSHSFQKLNLPVEGIPRVTAAENKPWGMCELAVVDPDGNLLRIGHELP